MWPLMRVLVSSLLFICLGAENKVWAEDSPTGNANRGEVLFQQTCALCHADNLGPGNTVIIKQGPSLVDVLGRYAGSGLNFKYTDALARSGLTWDTSTLDRFLTNPTSKVPGTTMMISVVNAADRLDLIAYMATLKTPANVPPAANPAPALSPSSQTNAGDWFHAAPGVRYHFTPTDLPVPFATTSAGNGPHVVKPPEKRHSVGPTGIQGSSLRHRFSKSPDRAGGSQWGYLRG